MRRNFLKMTVLGLGALSLDVELPALTDATDVVWPGPTFATHHIYVKLYTDSGEVTAPIVHSERVDERAVALTAELVARERITIHGGALVIDAPPFHLELPIRGLWPMVIEEDGSLTIQMDRVELRPA